MVIQKHECCSSSTSDYDPRNGGDDSVLYQALYDRRWDECRTLLRRPDAYRLVSYDDAVPGYRTLHCACDRNAPLDVVERVHRLRPDLIWSETYQGSAGFTPLHFACDGASNDVVEYLLREAPECAESPDADGDLPLHIAVQGGRPPSTMRSLLAVWPEASYATNENGNTPLREFVQVWWRDVMGHNHGNRRRDDDDGSEIVSVDAELVTRTLSLLLETFVRGVAADRKEEDSVRKRSDWLLLHEVVRHYARVPIATAIVLLVFRTTDRGECAQPDRNGDFPLHLACAQSPMIRSYRFGDDDG